MVEARDTVTGRATDDGDQDDEADVAFVPKQSSKRAGDGECSDSSSSDSDSDNDGAVKVKRTRPEGEDRVSDDELSALQKEAEEEGAGQLGKRRRLTKEEQEVEAARIKSSGSASGTADSTAAEQAWEDIKAGVGLPKTGRTLGGGDSPSQAELSYIRVIQSYRFAGEDHTNEKLLPESHPDAQAYLLAQAKVGKAVPRLRSDGTALLGAEGSGVAMPVEKLPPSASPAAASSSTASTSAQPPAPGMSPPPRPGPRKKKSSLAAMSAAVTAPRAPKLNTLEKSKLDWEGWKSAAPAAQAGLTDAEREEMEAQTKGGSSGLGSMKGYMERKQFLERVEGRLDEAQDPSSKR